MCLFHRGDKGLLGLMRKRPHEKLVRLLAGCVAIPENDSRPQLDRSPLRRGFDVVDMSCEGSIGEALIHWLF